MDILKRLTFGSKILLALLLTALLSTLLTGWIGYSTGRDGLKNAVFEQLESIRGIQANTITDSFNRTLDTVLTISESNVTVDATKQFKGAFDKLKDAKISPEQKAKLASYYQKDFIPRLAQDTDVQPMLENYLPYQPAQEYLQYEYIAANPYKIGEKDKLNLAKDKSEYSAVHNKFHPKLRNFVDRFEYYDLFVVDADTGQVLYSDKKEVDFMTNLKDGPYSSSALAKAYQKSILSKGDLLYVSLVDYEHYVPTYGAPAAFITSPIYDGPKMIGVLIVQMGVNHLNDLLNFRGKWEEAGLGETGETYLIGEDHLMRTTARRFIQHRAEYLKSFKEHGYDPEVLARADKQNTPVLNIKVNIDSINRALAGKSGTILEKSSGGLDILSAYQPIKIGDFRWALIARKEQAEAFAPITKLTHRLIITLGVLIPLITLLALYLSRMLADPINRLINAVKKIAAGEKNVRVNVDSRDEIGRLSNTFNDMASRIDEKDEVIQEKIAENNRLLLNVLPEPVAKRLQSGEQDIADSFSNVTIIYVEIEGFAEIADSRNANQSMRLLQDLISSFDDMADQYGVEKLKTMGSSYIAVCGLSIQRVDQAKRSVDFAMAILKLMNAFNLKHGADLGLDIGIHSGPVVAGVIGKSKFIYELWGETMNIAQLIHSSPGTNNIQVSESVHSALFGQYDFQSIDSFSIKGKGNIPVWTIHTLDSLSSSDNAEVKV
ncbi:MAG: adenylate/guanylate cyclase domain-containing protein [Cyanobacteriota bacterium ELA615]